MDTSMLNQIDAASVAYSEGFLEEWLTQSAARGTPASQQLLDNFKVLQVAIANYRKIIQDQQDKLNQAKNILS